MEFKSYYDKLSASEKRELAEKLDTSRFYLSQLANGKRKAGAKFLLNIFEATSGVITPKTLRPEKIIQAQ